MSKDRLSLSRRTLLQAAGLGAGAFFFPSLARGQEVPTRPRRLIIMMTELGWNPFEFRMAPPGAPDEVLWRSAYHPQYKDQPDPLRWQLDLTRMAQNEYSSTLAPLWPIRDKVLALDGLGMLSIGTDGLGDAHAKGWNHALSGYPAGEFITGQRALGGRPSIDMQISQFLRDRESHLTDLAALHFYINHRWWGGGVDTFHHFFHDEGPSGEIVKVPTEPNPQRVFDRLFPNGTAPGDTTDPIDAGQSNILDILGDRYAKVFPHLSGRDRQKLELHRQLIADISERLELLSRVSCETPSRPGSINDLDDNEAFGANIDAFFNLAAVALSCDLTRVVSMQFPNPPPARLMRYGAADLDFHEWYSHGTNPPVHWYGTEGANVSQEDYNKYTDAAPVIAAKNRFHMEQAVRLANLLDEIPDGDGTLLDNTMILVMDEISHGSHGHDQWPIVTIGGFGGAVRPGRYIRFPRTNPRPAFNGSGNYAGVPHNHLLVSICQAFGMEIDHMGIESVYARVPGEAGQYISMTGPLNEIA